MKFPNLRLEPVSEFDGFFDPVSTTISYAVKDWASRACVIIDSVSATDCAGGWISYGSAGAIPCDESDAPMLTVSQNGS